MLEFFCFSENVGDFQCAGSEQNAGVFSRMREAGGLAPGGGI